LEDIVLLAAFTSFTKMCQYSCVKWHHLCFPRIVLQGKFTGPPRTWGWILQEIHQIYLTSRIHS
jgi:hypothetical protein